MNRKRSRSASVLSQATQVAKAIHLQDQQAEQKLEQERGLRTTLPISKIQPRLEDTRPLHDKHVRDLVESISALGLIEPLVVDNKGILLAGGHRLAALSVLREANLEKFEEHFPATNIPVRIMEFDSSEDPELSLQIELAENEKRVNYSRDQIERLADRLRTLNYRETRGRPKTGEKPLGPALAVAIGVSTRYVRKVLSDQRNTRQDNASKKNRNSVPIFQKRVKQLKKIQGDLEKMIELLESGESTGAEKSLNKASSTYLRKITSYLGKNVT